MCPFLAPVDSMHQARVGKGTGPAASEVHEPEDDSLNANFIGFFHKNTPASTLYNFLIRIYVLCVELLKFNETFLIS